MHWAIRYDIETNRSTQKYKILSYNYVHLLFSKSYGIYSPLELLNSINRIYKSQEKIHRLNNITFVSEIDTFLTWNLLNELHMTTQFYNYTYSIKYAAAGVKCL